MAPTIRRYPALASVRIAILFLAGGFSVFRSSHSFLLGSSAIAPSKATRGVPRSSSRQTSTGAVIDGSVAAKETTEDESAAIELGRSELSSYFDFPLDDWQLRAGGEILSGHNVIVCAPTGAGKTVCGEMALHVAFDRGQNGVYTTPLSECQEELIAND